MDEDLIIKLIDTWGLGRMSDFITMLELAEEYKIELGDLRAYMRDVSRFTKQKGLGLKCPDCGADCKIVSINTNARDQLEGDYHSMVMCTDEMGCGWLRADSKTAEQWADFMRVPKILRRHPVPKRLACPQCGKPAYLMPVNTSPATMVGGKFQSLLGCYDWQGCGYESYSRKSPGEIMRKLTR